MTPPPSRSTVERPLPESAVEYVRSCLADGHSLARRVARKLEPHRLEVTALLPPGLPEERALDFREAVFPEPPPSEWAKIEGGWAVPVGNTTTELAVLVHEFLEAAPQRVAVFENFLSKPSYRYVSKYRSRMWFCGEEIYHYSLPGDSREDVERTISDAFHVVFLRGFLVSPGRPIPTRVGTVGEEVLESLAHDTERCIVAAYDGESFLLARPAER